MAFDFGNTIAGIAPTLGRLIQGALVGGAKGAIAGPGGIVAGAVTGLGATAIREVATALGMSDAQTATPDQLVSAVSARTEAGLSPQEMANIRKQDQEFEIHCRDQGIQLFEVEVQDRQGARAYGASSADNSRRQYFIALLIIWTWVLCTVALGAALIALLWSDVKLDGATSTVVFGTLGTAYGYLTSEAKAATTFYFGASPSSDQRSEAMSSAVKDMGRAVRK